MKSILLILESFHQIIANQERTCKPIVLIERCLNKSLALVKGWKLQKYQTYPRSAKPSIESSCLSFPSMCGRAAGSEACTHTDTTSLSPNNTGLTAASGADLLADDGWTRFWQTPRDCGATCQQYCQLQRAPPRASVANK